MIDQDGIDRHFVGSFLVFNFLDEDVKIQNSQLGSAMLKFLKDSSLIQDDEWKPKREFDIETFMGKFNVKEAKNMYVLFFQKFNKTSFTKLNKTIEEFEDYLKKIFLEILQIITAKTNVQTFAIRKSAFESFSFLAKDYKGIVFSKKEMELRTKRAFYKAFNELILISKELLIYTE